MGTFFYKIFEIIRKNRLPAFIAFLVLLGGMAFFASRLNFTEDITQLIPKSKESQKLQEVLNTVNFSDKVIVNVQAKDTATREDLTAYAEIFLQTIKPSPHIANIQGKVPQDNVLQTYTFVNEHLPLFLTERDYQIIEKRLAKDSISKRVGQAYRSLTSPAGMFTKQFLLKDPLGFTSLGLEKLKTLQFSSGFTLYNNFLITQDGKNLLLFITPTEEAKSAKNSEVFAQELRKILNKLNQKNLNVTAEAVGAILYSVANATQIKKDIFTSVGIALGVLIIILIWFYRKIYIPFLLLLPSVFGGITALFFLYWFQAEVSLIALGIGSVLIGISLDYSLHILTHYRANPNVKELYARVSKPVLLSSFTTASAFLCLGFIDSPALNDLGYFAAISVVTTAIYALLFLPHLYKPKENFANRKTVLDKFAQYAFHKNIYLLIGTGIVFIAALFYFQKVSFTSNLSKLNYQPTYLKQAEKNLDSVANMHGKNIYVISHAKTLEKALLKNSQLFKQLETAKKEKEILSYASVGQVLLPKTKQEEKIKKWQNFWNDQRLNNLEKQLSLAIKETGFKASSFNDFKNKLKKTYKPIGVAEYTKLEALSLNEFIDSSATKALYTVLSTAKSPQENAEEFRKRFKKDENLLLINRKSLNESLLGNLKSQFNNLVLYSLAAVFLLLLLVNRSLKWGLLTMLPIAITWIIALGIMYWLKIEFNIFNIIITSFIFGLGIDYSIFISNGLRYEKENLATYKTSIFLSVITTILGIGVLIFAKHPALHSVAAISVIGILCVSFVTICVQPFLFKVFFKRIDSVKMKTDSN